MSYRTIGVMRSDNVPWLAHKLDEPIASVPVSDHGLQEFYTYYPHCNEWYRRRELGIYRPYGPPEQVIDEDVPDGLTWQVWYEPV